MQNTSFLVLIRSLTRCYQAFESYSARHVRSMDLTPCQFDIIMALGNTSDMNYRELSERTLTIKSTLTGVVERLKEKGLVQCEIAPHDGRSQIVSLTEAGVTLFEEIFPAHVVYMARALGHFSEAEIEAMRLALSKLGNAF